MIGKLPTSALRCAANSRNPVDRSCIGVAAISWLIAGGLFCGVAGGVGTAQAGADSGTVGNSPGGARRRRRSPATAAPRRPAIIDRATGLRHRSHQTERRRERRQVGCRRTPRFHRLPGPVQRHTRTIRIPMPQVRSDPGPCAAVLARSRRRGRHTPSPSLRGIPGRRRARVGGGGGGNGGGIAVTIPSPTVPGQPGEPTPVQVSGGRPRVRRDRRAAHGPDAAVVGLPPVIEAPLRPVGTPVKALPRPKPGRADVPPRPRNRTRPASGHRPASETPQKHPLRLGWAIPSTSGRPRRARSPHWLYRESSDCSP